jgi:hypothetical protein
MGSRQRAMYPIVRDARAVDARPTPPASPDRFLSRFHSRAAVRGTRDRVALPGAPDPIPISTSSPSEDFARSAK